MTIFYPTYISAKHIEPPKSLIGIYINICQQDPQPMYCELPDGLGKSKSQLPQSFTFTAITASGTASGATTSTIRLGMEYVVNNKE
ncbi:MAG: hypothetical protein WC503_05660 [Candidatus Shapirobacteria bacterium]